MSFAGSLGNLIKYTAVFNRMFSQGEKHWKSFGETLNKVMTAKSGYFLDKAGGAKSLTGKVGDPGFSISKAAFDALPGRKKRGIGEDIGDIFGRGRSKTDRFGGATDLIGKAIGKPIEWATSPIRKIRATGKAFGAGFGADPADAAKMGRAGRAGNWLGNAMEKITKVPAKTWKEMGSAVGGLAKAGLQSMGIGIAVDLLMKFMDALNPFKPVIEALSDIFGVWGAIMSMAFMPLIEALYDVMLSPVVLAAFETLAGLFSRVVIAFLPLLDIIAPIGLLLLNLLIPPLEMLIPIIELVAIPLGWLGSAMSGLTDSIGVVYYWWDTYIAPIFDSLGGIFSTIAGFTFPDLSAGWAAISNGFKTSLINPIIGFINAFSRMLNSWDVLNWFPDIPMIPALASGALVTKPTIALIGESGPERVLNAEETRSYQSGNGGGSTTYNFYGPITQDRIFELKRMQYLKSIRS